MINRPATRPDFRQPIGPIYGMPSNPLFAAIMQSVVQQQQQEQQKAQIMQALGFGGNMSPFGAIPQGHGIINMDGKAWTRPGGTPPGIQMLLESMLGVQNSNSARGFKRDVFDLAEPQPVERGLQQAQQSPQMLDFLLQLYPELMPPADLPQNSGSSSMAPAFYPRQRPGGF